MTDTWFSFDLPPFDRLTPSQREEVRAALDLGFYPKDSVILGGDEVAEVLDLLQHGVGHTAGERVATQQQHGQTVGVRHTGRRDHVERAGADRRGGHHDLAAAHGFRRPRPARRWAAGD